MARHYKQGIYSPIHPEKYIGNVNNIVFRSGWEFHFIRYCDMNENVLRWSSEEVVIPYFFDVDGKMHRYFCDFYIEIKKRDGSIEKLLIEIKPQSQIDKPKVTKVNKGNQEKVLTWLKNQAKWKAAEEYAKQRGWKFMTLSEHDLGIKH